jgi:transcriptional regulator
MHVSRLFRPLSERQVVDTIKRLCFGTLVTHTVSGFDATPLPWSVEIIDDSLILLGHLANINPQIEQLKPQSDVLVTFTGVNGYVSPRILPTPFSAPTWNYEAVHVYGEAMLLDGNETEETVEKLVATLESTRPEPWSTSEMWTRRNVLIKHVTGVRIVATKIVAKYRLGQNETDVDLQAILAHLDSINSHDLANAMREVNCDRK